MTSRHRGTYCGIDWAEGHHDIALVDQDGTLIAKRRIKDSSNGYAELLELLAEAGDSGVGPSGWRSSRTGSSGIRRW